MRCAPTLRFLCGFAARFAEKLCFSGMSVGSFAAMPPLLSFGDKDGGIAANHWGNPTEKHSFSAHRRAKPVRLDGPITFLVAIFLFVFLPLAVSAQTRERTAGAKPKTAEQELRTVIANWARAVRNRDISTLDALFADDLFITDFSGGTRTKREELEILKPSATTRTVSVTNESVAVRTYPKSNIGVITAVVRMIFRTNGRDSTMAMRYTSVWEKRRGRWHLTVLQTTRITPR